MPKQSKDYADMFKYHPSNEPSTKIVMRIYLELFQDCFPDQILPLKIEDGKEDGLDHKIDGEYKYDHKDWNRDTFFQRLIDWNNAEYKKHKNNKEIKEILFSKDWDDLKIKDVETFKSEHGGSPRFSQQFSHARTQFLIQMGFKKDTDDHNILKDRLKLPRIANKKAKETTDFAQMYKDMFGIK